MLHLGSQYTEHLGVPLRAAQRTTLKSPKTCMRYFPLRRLRGFITGPCRCPWPLAAVAAAAATGNSAVAGVAAVAAVAAATRSAVLSPRLAAAMVAVSVAVRAVALAAVALAVAL